MPTASRAQPITPPLWPKQLACYRQSTARVNIAWGPVRSGKTHGLELWRWLYHVRFGPKGQLLMSGRTLKTLERNVLRPLRDLIGPKRITWSLGAKSATILGRHIELEGANDEGAQDKIAGMTLAGALQNEITRSPESYYNETMARLSVAGAQYFGTTNTAGPYHWLKTQVLERSGELNEGTDAARMRHWKFMLEDNGSLPPDYVESLKRQYTGLWYKRYILGLWVLAAGLVYEGFDPERHVRRLDRPFEGHYLDCDYGIASSSMTWSLKAYWHQDYDTVAPDGTKRSVRRPHVHTLREYVHTGNTDGRKTDAEYAAEKEHWLSEHFPRIARPVVYLDPSATSYAEALRRKGFTVIEAINDVIPGIRFTETMLAEDRFTMDPQCTVSAGQYSSYIWDERAALRGEDKPLKQNDHGPDRDRYGIFTRFGRPPVQARATTVDWL